jgi:hypothetical protein
MYFGDTGAANKMQFEMEKTLEIGTEQGRNRRAYVDNVLIFEKGASIEQHAEEVRLFLPFKPL